ncbi:MAG: MazG-like family protein [Candidatus Omnitrophota bacterium]|jgi:NTP pyrophosphatase (non-canonical NTP hydrolase)
MMPVGPLMIEHRLIERMISLMAKEVRKIKESNVAKPMALSLVLEAAEVLEHFQWKSQSEVEKHGAACKDEIAEELADNLGIDLSDAVGQKLTKNAKKYPIEKAKGKHTKYDKL